MNILKRFNENSNDEFLLITHHESGDEIHFTVINYSYYPEISKILDIITSKYNHQLAEDMIELINNNKVEELMVQTYCLEDFSKINKYNIIKCINLPELGT